MADPRPKRPTIDVTLAKHGAIPKQVKLPSVTDLTSSNHDQGRSEHHPRVVRDSWSRDVRIPL